MRRWTVRLAALLAMLAASAWNWAGGSRLKSAESAYRSGRYVQALQNALDHSRARPWSKEAARLAALSLSQLDFCEQAEGYYDRLGPLSLEDEHVRALGIVRCNRREEAIEAYERILAKWPEDASALSRLGGVYLSQNRLRDSLKLAERLARRPGYEVVGATMAGTLCHRLMESSEAVAWFEEVIRRDPGLETMPLPKPQFWQSFGRELLNEGKATEAVERLEAYLATDPEQPALRSVLGDAYHAAGRLDDAEASWKRSLEGDATQYDTWDNLGRLALIRNEPEKAIEPLTRAVELNPRAYSPLYNLYMANRRLGRQAEAARLGARLEGMRRTSGTPTEQMGKPPTEPDAAP